MNDALIPAEADLLATEIPADMIKAIEAIVEKYGGRNLPIAADHEEARRLFAATNEELADYFDAAHDLLLTEGWVQKAMRSDEGRCAMGAMCDALPFFKASNGRTRFSVVRDQMYEVVLGEIGHKRGRGSRIAEWNDRGGRTIDDVLDLFRRCAKTLRNKES